MNTLIAFLVTLGVLIVAGTHEPVRAWTRT